jgi:enoyl-CoA hydratase/carnithine racemase
MHVEVERHERWARLTLNRPERRNAITGPLASELAAAIRALDEDEEVQTILLCGAGGAFCSGLDLKEFNADPEPEWLADFGAAWRATHIALFECVTPIVGALERFAINGGAALALACDLLVVGEDSYLQIGEVRQGMGAPYNLAWLALRHPETVGLRLSLIGDRVPGPALLELGVAYSCVPDAEVMQHAMSLSAAIADYPPGAARRIKTVLTGFSRGDASEWFERATGRDTGAGRMKPRAVDR